MRPKSQPSSRAITINRINRLMVFDRREIAQIVLVHPALIRNWSMGNPFRIEPSIRAPGRKGAANLYALEEVYLFGVAGYLGRADIPPRLAKKVLSYLREHSDLLQEEQRDVYLAFHGPLLWGMTPTFQYEVMHHSKEELVDFVRDKDGMVREFGFFLICMHLGAILDWIDQQIAKWERKQKERGKKARRSKSGKRRK